MEGRGRREWVDRMTGVLLIALVALAPACASIQEQPPAVGTPAMAEPDFAPEPPATFVVIHGAWGGGWAWAAVDSMLTAAGHAMTRPTLTGLGERVHLADAGTDLETHISDVVNHLVFERLGDVVLVGHSYGGMVAMGVLHRVPERIRRVVLVDAFLPEDGESVVDAVRGTGLETWIGTLVAGAENGLIVPSWLDPGDAWPGDVPQPLATFTRPITLGSAAAGRVPGTYILTAAPDSDPAGDFFAPFAGRAAAMGWEVLVLRADHNPQSSAPERLTALLRDAVR